jgi:large subunit ribosomal protein L18
MTIETSAARRARRNTYRAKTRATEGRLRLSVFRSNTNIYAQVIDDTKGQTVASASTVDSNLRKSVKSGGNLDAAKLVGTEIGKRAIKAGVKDVYFDRGAYRYQGRVKALADAAREAGLNF